MRHGVAAEPDGSRSFTELRAAVGAHPGLASPHRERDLDHEDLPVREERGGRGTKRGRPAKRGPAPIDDTSPAAEASASAPAVERPVPSRGKSKQKAAAKSKLKAAPRPNVTQVSPAKRAKAQPKTARPKAARPKAAAKTVTPKTARPKKTGRKVRRTMLLVGGVGCAAAAAVLAMDVLSGPGQPHAISTPQRLMSYAQEPSLATGMGASALRSKIVSMGSGEASHVVDAVYEDSSGPAAKSGPQIILFVGGNLSGSASSFISSLTSALPGAFVINPGSLGGQAACVPGLSGHLTECVWADNDTFGVIASPTLNAPSLGTELREMRPLLEHVVK